MPIPKLNKESHAFFVLQNLHGQHMRLTRLIADLRNTAILFTTVDLIKQQTSYKSMYNYIKDFWASDSAWFTSVFPDWAAVIPGYFTSMEKINAAIVTGLQSGYWSADLNRPVMVDISQADRNILADMIEGELEV